MATRAPQYPLGSPQVHIPTCEKHNVNKYNICEDCDEFICPLCTKTDHKDHDWKTIPTAGSLRRRELKKILDKIKEEGVKEMDKAIEMTDTQLKENQQFCDSELLKLQKHYKVILSKLDENGKYHEKMLRDNLENANSDVRKKKSDVEEKKEQVMELVKFLEENNSTLSDYSLIDSLRDIKRLTSSRYSDMQMKKYSLIYIREETRDQLIKFLMGITFDLDELIISESLSFQYGVEGIYVLEATNEDTCIVREMDSEHIERVNQKNEREIKFNRTVNDACLAKNGYVYITDTVSNCIACLPPSGLDSTVYSTGHLKPIGICESDGGLLVTLRDTESELYQPDSNSRRLVRLVTLDDKVIKGSICEYEFQEDGRTRLFTVPFRVKQNGNTDICVVNWTNNDTGELLILSMLGSLKYVYPGQYLIEKFKPFDLVCDSLCNIIVSNYSKNGQVRLLNCYGEFIKYLLTENEVKNIWSMSLYRTTLWVGDRNGLIKVFQYKT